MGKERKLFEFVKQRLSTLHTLRIGFGNRFNDADPTIDLESWSCHIDYFGRRESRRANIVPISATFTSRLLSDMPCDMLGSLWMQQWPAFKFWRFPHDKGP